LLAHVVLVGLLKELLVVADELENPLRVPPLSHRVVILGQLPHALERGLRGHIRVRQLLFYSLKCRNYILELSNWLENVLLLVLLPSLPV